VIRSSISFLLTLLLSINSEITKTCAYYSPVLTTSQPTYLFKLVTVQSPRSTRSSSVVRISRPPTSSSLIITNRSFQHAAPHLWNKLPHSFREPHPHPGLSPSHRLHKSDPHCHHHFYHHHSSFFTQSL